MPRHAAVIPNRRIETTLPEPLWHQIETCLYSPLESKIPYGAFQSLIIRLLTDFLSREEADLSPFLGLMPGEAQISAHPRTLALLLNHLTKDAS